MIGCFNSSLDIMEISLAVLKCPGALRPVAFSKWVLVIPSSLALSFIFTAKASSLPSKNSAIATAASFPDAIAIPFRISSTVLTSPVSNIILLPPMDLTFSLQTILSWRFILPSSKASIASNIVIILVTEAGANCSSAFFS